MISGPGVAPQEIDLSLVAATTGEPGLVGALLECIASQPFLPHLAINLVDQGGTPVLAREPAIVLQHPSKIQPWNRWATRRDPR